jgi:uncharacterized delta-60 repeat protein
MRRLALLTLFMAAAVVPTSGARAASALLDTTFGGDGVVTAFPNGGVATAVGIDERRRITVVGYTVQRHPDVVAARFLSDGTPDTSFAGDGTARFDLGADDYAFDAAFTPRGGMAIVGRRTAREDRIFVLRLSADGARVRSFGGDGQVLVDAGTRAQSADAVAFTPQGRIVAGGYVSSGVQARSVLVRFGDTGALDRGFGHDGIAIYDIGNGTEQINDLLVLPGGAIVAAGAAEVGQQPRFSILRVRSDGRLDTSFGRSAGYTVQDLSRGADVANALTVASNGDYLLAGSSHGDWAVAAFTAGGRSDRSYGNEGHRILPGDATFEQATGVVQANRKTYLVGTVHGDSEDLGVARLRAGGTLDPTFSSDGRVAIDTSDARDTGAAAILQGNGKLAVAGATWRRGAPRFLIVRLRPS